MRPGAVQCVWFKRDLRLLDHAPLVEAVRRGPVLPLFLVEPSLVAAPDFDALHWHFIREALGDLQARLAGLGCPLQIVRGEATEVFATLHQRHCFETLWAHEETGNALTYRRDRTVARWCREAGVAWRELPQNGVVRGLRDRDGWARRWEQRMSEPVLPAPTEMRAAAGLRACPIPTASALGLEETPRQVDLAGGEGAAQAQLESFVNGRGRRYHREMSSPNTAYASCSRLSPSLAWGCLSLRTVVQTVRRAAGETMPKVAARSFLSRCHWHCHFMQKLESEPAIEFHAFNRACDALREDGHRPEWLAAWQAGRTGYPFLDACMRSLRARGWINFRMRAMLVSFASYHLWIDWRQFKDWLACQFIDYEPGIHLSQLQMQSGLTGINTLRIYNPVKQGQDHDPAGVFIRTWVPELRGVTGEWIHEPWRLPEAAQAAAGCRIGVDYPLPIVEHTTAVRRARAAFARLRERDDYWESARAVLERHGSRQRAGRRARPRRAAKKSPPAQGEFEWSGDAPAPADSA